MIQELLRLAGQAGGAILQVYQSDFKIEHKDDRSPVTAADRLAEDIILAGLAKLTPSIPVIAEEQAATFGLPEDIPDEFWLVDPLDGTKEFLKRNGEFTVNIALVKNGHPILGVIHLPANNSYYWTEEGKAFYQKGNEAAKQISTRIIPSEGAIILSSRSHGGEDFSALLGSIKIAGEAVAGSSLKFCRLAEGVADIYPRLKPTMEWDIAAGHAILNAAGGEVRLLDGSPMMYGKKGFLNPHFIARGYVTSA